MKALKDMKKSRGKALNALPKICGVYTKELLQYGHEPPKRPRKGNVDIAEAETSFIL